MWVPDVFSFSFFFPSFSSFSVSFLNHFFFFFVPRKALDCLSIALAAQDASTWALPITQSIFKKVTAVSLDPRPKVRKSAQDAVTSLLRNPKCASVATSVVGTFCLHASKQLDLSNSQKVIHFVHLLKDFMPFLQSQASFLVFELFCMTIHHLIPFPTSFFPLRGSSGLR